MADLESIFKRDYTLSLMSPDPVRETPFWTSGAFNSDGRISALINAKTQTFEVPAINELDAKVEPNYSNYKFSDHSVPRSIGGWKMNGRMAYLNESWWEGDLEKLLTLESPLEAIAKQVTGYWAEEAEQRAVATVAGIYNYDQANGKNITTEGTGSFDPRTFLTAESKMKKKYRGKGAIVLHPDVAMELRLAKLLIPFTDPTNLTAVETYNGRTVIESYDNTKVGAGNNLRYISYLVNQNAFAAESVAGQKDLELARDPSAGNGGGVTVLHTRRNMLIHPMGFSFVLPESELTGGTKNQSISANWKDLTRADAWALSTPDVKNVPFHFVVTK